MQPQFKMDYKKPEQTLMEEQSESMLPNLQVEREMEEIEEAVVSAEEAVASEAVIEAALEAVIDEVASEAVIEEVASEAVASEVDQEEAEVETWLTVILLPRKVP